MAGDVGVALSQLRASIFSRKRIIGLPYPVGTVVGGGGSDGYEQPDLAPSGSQYETFPVAEVRWIAKRLKFYDSPKRGSWLNTAETEFSTLSRSP